MLTSLVFFVINKFQKIQIIDENSKNRRQKSSYRLNDLVNFNQFLEENITYENTKNHKNSEIQSLSISLFRKYLYGKSRYQGRIHD